MQTGVAPAIRERTDGATEWPLTDLASAALGQLFEIQPIGIVVLDGQGRVLLANRAARRMAGRGDSFCLNERLAVLRSADAATLLRAIERALSGCASSLRLERRSSDRAYKILAMPLLPGPTGAQAVALSIADPDLPPLPTRDALITLYGLTATESRIALLLLGGHPIDAAGAALGMRPLTARSHLRAILRKTRCRRQVELVRLLSTLPPQTVGA